MNNKPFICWLLLICCFVCVERSWGFLPPVDEHGGIKLSIEGIGETVNLEEGVHFKVVAENATAQALTIALKVWMNDDWTVAPAPNVPPFELPANGKQEFEFQGTAQKRALEAWYPVHALATVMSNEGEAFELHPIAVFKAEKTRMKEEKATVVTGGEEQNAWLAKKEVRVDGLLNEWWDQAIPISCGSEHVSVGKVAGDSFDAIVMFMHDQNNIYVAGQIVDDDISCEDVTSDDFMNSDYLRFYFHGQEPGKRKGSAFTEADKIIAVNTFGGRNETALPKVPSYGKSELPEEFKIVTRRTGMGYTFEASIPKTVIGAEKSKAIGMALMIGDADKKVRRSEVHFGWNIPNYWVDPSSYFKLNLAGARGAQQMEDFQPETIVVGNAGLRLDSAVSRRVAYKLTDAKTETVMPRGFDGTDRVSGMILQNKKEVIRRDDVRDGLVCHPPFREGTGYMKVTYRLQLPEKNEAVFKFSTAVGDPEEGEKPGDGVEFIVEVHDDLKIRRLYRRVSKTKTWSPVELDLRSFKGKTIDLSLIVTPGEHNDGNSDECYWGTPQINLKARYQAETPAEKAERRIMAISLAQRAITDPNGLGRYQLKSADGTVYGAGIIPGPEGLVDCFLVFASEEDYIVYEGFTFEVAGVLYGQSHDGEPIAWKGFEKKYGRDIYRHLIETEEYGKVPLEVRVRPYGGTLQFTFVMPNVKRDLRGQPRYTKLAVAKGSETPWRIYGGFGNVIESPSEDFTLSRGGFTLNTRHVGVDYQNGISMAIATDFFPDRMVCKPSENLFTLEAHNDVTFYFAPSEKNAFMAAKEYGRIVGFKPSPGLEELYGRQCLDQWGGDYSMAADNVRMAAKYGMGHSIFVKHVWQRWGYDYRLPEIYPPLGGLEPFKQLADACRENDIIFAPHDNYIDFYPDAEGFSYDHIIFNHDGTPQRAWYNKGREAQSYRWLPHAFKPWLVKNMELIRDNIGARGLFIDVFSAIPPMDYYDREGRFYDSKRTAKEWAGAFDTCRDILWKGHAPMLSECGHDGLIGSLDGGQADHYSANRWGAESDWERVPWHDIVSHGKFILLGGGLGGRYAEKDPRGPSGYGTDNYNGMTAIGGRNPMSDGPFSINAVKTYWMLHDACNWLSRKKFRSFEFGMQDSKRRDNEYEERKDKYQFTSIHRLHAVFGDDEEAGEVWSNRSDETWTVLPDEPPKAVGEEEEKEEDKDADEEEKEDDEEKEEDKPEGVVLPKYGYYMKTPYVTVGVVEKDGKTVAFSRKDGCFFYDARPPYGSVLSHKKIMAKVTELKKVSELVYEMEVEWNFEVGSTMEKAAQFIHVTHPSSKQGESILYYGTVVKSDVNHKKPGVYHSTIRLNFPENVPDGDLTILYGIFNPQSGGRLSVSGARMVGDRVFGGTIRATRVNGKATTEIVENGEKEESGTLDLPMVDFDGVKTNGSFRWVRENARRWLLIPVPGSLPFRVEAAQEYLTGLSDARTVSVTNVDPWNETARKPKVTFLEGVLSLEVDGRSFAYRIEFK